VGAAAARAGAALSRAAGGAARVGEDIAPDEDRRALHAQDELPVDGIFVGYNWHSLENDATGARWRWVDRDAQIVVTRPSGARRSLVLDLAPGPGIVKPMPRLEIRDASDAVVAKAVVPAAGPVTIKLPLAAGPGAVFAIAAPDGGRRIQGDPRILNFRIFAVRWAER
jgi:hypothetical protein